jgi:sugar-specific transcriptional regulator TrmB
LYRPVSPEQAFGVAEERLHLAKEKLPELLAMTKGADTKLNVLYFEGIKGIKQAMEFKRDEDKGKEFVGFYATSKDLPKEITDYFTEWNEKNRKRGITMRGIVPDHESLAAYRENDVRHGRTMKVIPYEEFSSEVAIDISQRIVRIHDYKNMQGIVIENEDVAKTMKEIFEMVWKRV